MKDHLWNWVTTKPAGFHPVHSFLLNCYERMQSLGCELSHGSGWEQALGNSQWKTKASTKSPMMNQILSSPTWEAHLHQADPLSSEASSKSPALENSFTIAHVDLKEDDPRKPVLDSWLTGPPKWQLSCFKIMRSRIVSYTAVTKAEMRLLGFKLWATPGMQS